MNHKITKLLISVVTICLSCASLAFSEIKHCGKTDNLTFTPQDIFDLNDKETIFLHRWANFLHIKTKKKTLENEAAFFLEKCQHDDSDLSELERFLRNKKYLRDAKVSRTKDNKISVETWDNWTLLPTLDFNRKGGKNSTSIGIKDRNLLGLGIDAEIEYFNNYRRSGYKFDTQFPLFLNNNINGSIRLIKSEDGNSQLIFIEKQFVSFDTKNAFKVGIDNFDQIDTQYQNGKETIHYGHKKSSAAANWQWLYRDTEFNTLRFGLGYANEEHLFANALDHELPVSYALPKDRHYRYPFLSINYLEKDYRKLSNINLINHIEDFNLGWDFNARLGSDFSNREHSPIAIWQANLSKGIALFDASYLFFNLDYQGEIFNEKNAKDRQLLTLSTEFVHKFNERWGGYLKNVTRLSKNQFADEPIVLGAESGIRGFPIQYQHGKHSTQFSFETRYYPHINIYKLIELGGVAFIDSGKTFGESLYTNKKPSWMTSVGLGARFYSTRASDARVIHIDIIKPLSSDDNVNNVEFRISTKQTF